MIVAHIETDIPVSPEPKIDENPNALDIPASGFAIDVREGTVRMHFYISRGHDEAKRRDNHLIVHLPMNGFTKSFAWAAKKWLCPRCVAMN